VTLLLVVVGLLVVAILLSRYTWISKRGDRRSIQGHEDTMGVLRSLSGDQPRPPADPTADAAPGPTEPPAPPLPQPKLGPALPAASSDPPAPVRPAPPVDDRTTSEPDLVFYADGAGAGQDEGSLLPPLPAAAPILAEATLGATWWRGRAQRVVETVRSGGWHRRRDLSVAGALVLVVIGGVLGGLWATSHNGQSVRASQLTGSSPTTTVPVTTPPPTTTSTIPPTTTTLAPPATIYTPPTTYTPVYSPPTTTTPPPRIVIPSTTTTSPPTTIEPPPPSSPPPSFTIPTEPTPRPSFPTGPTHPGRHGF
jgi:hypothetical protein